MSTPDPCNSPAVALADAFVPGSVNIPKHIVQQRVRAPKKNIPQTTIERNHILHGVRRYVAEFNPVPPLPAEDLKVHAQRVMEMLRCDFIYRDGSAPPRATLSFL